ncbi:hypothetical protein ISR94_02815 [Candidatus Microgenomates bacterium]|nr:hypothetical protein [Candidatus Microgenomates bacterium]
MAEEPLDLLKLSREDLEKIFSADELSTKIREEAEMLHGLSDPEGSYVPVEELDLSEEWTVNVSPAVNVQILDLIK